MTRTVVRQLILKDLYFTRWITLSALVAGLGAVALMPISEVSGYVATVSLICTLAVLNIFLVMSAIAQERKDKVQLFFLSLPVSTTEYTIAKAVAKFDGGSNPARGCFAKLEAKQKLSNIKTLCDATGNTATASGKAQAFVAIAVVGLEP